MDRESVEMWGIWQSTAKTGTKLLSMADILEKLPAGIGQQQNVAKAGFRGSSCVDDSIAPIV